MPRLTLGGPRDVLGYLDAALFELLGVARLPQEKRRASPQRVTARPARVPRVVPLITREGWVRIEAVLRRALDDAYAAHPRDDAEVVWLEELLDAAHARTKPLR